jgi:hypothetical protein
MTPSPNVRAGIGVFPIPIKKHAIGMDVGYRARRSSLQLKYRKPFAAFGGKAFQKFNAPD